MVLPGTALPILFLVVLVDLDLPAFYLGLILE